MEAIMARLGARYDDGSLILEHGDEPAEMVSYAVHAACLHLSHAQLMYRSRAFDDEDLAYQTTAQMKAIGTCIAVAGSMRSYFVVNFGHRQASVATGAWIRSLLNPPRPAWSMSSPSIRCFTGRGRGAHARGARGGRTHRGYSVLPLGFAMYGLD